MVDDDIVSDGIATDDEVGAAAFDVGSHLSDAFNWPSSDVVAFVRFCDDIDNL